jgi:glutamate carboxypeptidase
MGDGLSGSVEVDGGWPGIEPNPGTQAIFAEVQRLASALDMAIGGQTSGGVSDGCWTSEAGVPTIDGVGPVGGCDHSPCEYILLNSVPERCALIAGLCEAIGSGLLSGLAVVEGGGAASASRG